MSQIGLSCEEAQQRLRSELTQFIERNGKVNWLSEIIQRLYTPLSSILMAMAGFLLIIQFATAHEKTTASELLLFHAFVLLILAFSNIGLLFLEILVLKTNQIRRLLVRIGPFMSELCPWTYSSYPKSSISSLRAHFTVPTYRDGCLVNLPTSLLVKDDVIELHKGIPSPANVVLMDDSEYSSDEVPNLALYIDEVPPTHLFRLEPNSTEENAIKFIPEAKSVRFIVTETPVISLLDFNLSKRRTDTFLSKEKDRVILVMEVLVGIVFGLSLLINIIKFFALRTDFDDSWPELVFGIPIYTSLPLLAVQLPLLWTVMNLYGTARITLLVEIGQDQLNPSGVVKRFRILMRTVIRMVQLIFRCSHYPHYCAFHILGSLTSVCAVDKEYLLTGGFPTPEKVFFLRTEDIGGDVHKNQGTKITQPCDQTSPVKEDSEVEAEEKVKFELQSPSVELYNYDLNSPDKNVHHSVQKSGEDAFTETPASDVGDYNLTVPTLNSKQVDTVSSCSVYSETIPFEVVTEILNLSPNFDNNSGLEFDDVNWNAHIGSLKPIGVNLLATSHLLKGIHQVSPSGTSKELHQQLHKVSCACALGVEIGVTEFFSNQFEKEVLLYTIGDVPAEDIQKSIQKPGITALSGNSNPVIQPHMISSVAKSFSSGKSLLMSRGSGDMIVSCSSDFWDGKDLQPMTETDRTTVLDYFNWRSHSSYCVALAYNPLLEVNVESLIDKKMFIYVPNSTLHRNYSETSLTGSTTGEVESQLTTAEQIFGHLQCNQVFLGVLSMQFRPKFDVVSLIEDLSVAGIRFVHFTAENEIRGKTFGQKLGLEVDWNCHISLAPPLEEDNLSANDSSSELCTTRSSSIASSLSSVMNTTLSYFRAKLPKGIENIRPHIETVDNVPLLVPLFTDCSTDTIWKMIQIMQENSEVVLCLGNAWNRENLHIFSQANISLSLIPEHVNSPVCTATETCALSTSTSSQNASTMSDEKTWPSPLELASYLNSTTCQLCFERDSDVSLLSLISESRHILGTIQHALLFGLGCSLSLAMLMLLSTIFFLPPPLSGSHLFWFLIFIIPLMMLSFLATPRDPKIKSQMPSKKKQILNNKWFFVLEFICLFVLSSVISLLLFGLTISEICRVDIPYSECHLLLGDRNVSSTSVWNGWRGDNEQGLLFAQEITAFFQTVYFVIMSIRFIHRTQPIWKLWRFISWQYLVIMTGTIVLQITYFAASQSLSIDRLHNLTQISHLSSVPVHVWIIGFLWPFILVPVLELFKFYDKTRLKRIQTHFRLEFGTKLGMHSPV